MKEKTFVTMKDFTKKYGIKFCANHTGKMQGMTSLSKDSFGDTWDYSVFIETFTE